jgi:serine/threonine protein kinase
VALKVLLDEHTDRFEREAKAISALNHPHICALYDIGTYDGLKYLVMEWIDGGPLRGPLPIQQAIHLGTDIADGLATAHREGVVHRDLKPSNILVGKSGLKLLDFGLARFSRVQAAAAASSTITQTQSSGAIIAGTLPYMAPEQLEGKPADPRSDIFAFGAVFYEMLTDKPAFEGSTQASLIGAIMRAEPVRVSQLQPLASGPLERIIDVCLAKDPDDRWQNAHDLRCALKLARDAVQPSLRPRRSLIAFPIACLLALTALTLGVVYFWVPPRSTVPYLCVVKMPTDSAASADRARFTPLHSNDTDDGDLRAGGSRLLSPPVTAYVPLLVDLVCPYPEHRECAPRCDRSRIREEAVADVAHSEG